jgi:hypothetical protein
MCFNVLSGAFILLPSVLMYKFMLMLMSVKVVVAVLPAPAWAMNVTVGGCDTGQV